MNKETTSANAKPTSPTSLCIFEHLISPLSRSTPKQQFKVPIEIATKMSGKFEPKQKVDLDPPKDDPISLDYLSKCDGTHEGYPTYVAIKGTVFDVTGNKAYEPGASYSVFAGKDASRALAQSSLKKEECRPEWEDLKPEHKKVLDDWFTFFSKRYNIKGKVTTGNSNL
ncbi:cytochrome b5 [Aureobasidium pullulans]|nr:cytochrome b5 [Aureobasidium pullulans]